jgi:hypothetical protein
VDAGSGQAIIFRISGVEVARIDVDGFTAAAGKEIEAPIVLASTELRSPSYSDAAGTGAPNVPDGMSWGSAAASMTSTGILRLAKLKGKDGATLDIEAGDTAGDDIWFSEGIGDGDNLRAFINGNSTIGIQTTAGASLVTWGNTTQTQATGVSLAFANGSTISGDTGAPTILTGNTQIGTADGDKLYFGSTSNYLEWDTGTTSLLINGDINARIDMDGKFLSMQQLILTEIAAPGVAAAGTVRLYRDSTLDDAMAQFESNLVTVASNP